MGHFRLLTPGTLSLVIDSLAATEEMMDCLFDNVLLTITGASAPEASEWVWNAEYEEVDLHLTKGTVLTFQTQSETAPLCAIDLYTVEECSFDKIFTLTNGIFDEYGTIWVDDGTQPVSVALTGCDDVMISFIEVTYLDVIDHREIFKMSADVLASLEGETRPDGSTFYPVDGLVFGKEMKVSMSMFSLENEASTAPGGIIKPANGDPYLSLPAGWALALTVEQPILLVNIYQELIDPETYPEDLYVAEDEEDLSTVYLLNLSEGSYDFLSVTITFNDR